MEYTIVPMTSDCLEDYAELYSGVFSSPPWNEPWSAEAAAKRSGAMMSAPTFVGRAMISGSTVTGFIFGQTEYTYSGTEFQIQEFCVASEYRHKGYGRALLADLRQALAESGVTAGIYLITSEGEQTEGWDRRSGFRRVDGMIVMNDTRE